jgi:alcohol dehydrogenase class IV
MARFTLPRLIFEGEDALEDFSHYLDDLGINRILIVTDEDLVRLGFHRIVLEKLGNRNIAIYDRVVPEPSFENVEDGGKFALEFEPDMIIALGGGSVIDAAKGIWIRYENPEFNLRDISPLVKIGVGKKSIFVSIPTTSGTGSEVTLGVVYSDYVDGKRQKIAMGSFELISNIVVLDPIFVKDLPKNLTLYTGLDALSHAVEALVSTSANSFSDALAIKSILNIFEYLPKIMKEPSNIHYRRIMHLTATMAGMSFSNSGLGLAHAVAHSIGGIFHIHHGRSVSIILPYVVKYNSGDSEASAKYEDMSKTLLLKGLAGDEDFYLQIYNFIKELGGDTSYKAIVSREEFFSKVDEAVENALQDPDIIYNPIIPDGESVKRLIIDAYSGNI